MAQFDLSKLMEGKNPTSIMLEQTRGLKNKWEKTGLLEGLGEKKKPTRYGSVVGKPSKTIAWWG